ncbi:aldehyde dehydrogenase family protein [Paracoccus marcusii]|uniref:aldehyde dehydrogenase family protein n=1 Tax=Paracoccus marcusii TaxID=59779 RepID=UPI002ED36AC2|nr:aldehyde dehydrogenase family protein [Paracoccus marcusii]
MQNAGQTCSAASRVLVQAGVYDEVRRRMSDIFNGLVAGPAPDSHDLGPLVSARQRRLVQDFIDLGTRELTLAAQGACILTRRPAAISCDPRYLRTYPDHTLAQQEIFGPVQVAMPFADEAEALRIANGTDYGLVAGIWTRDGARQLRLAGRLNCGQVFINNYGAGAGRAALRRHRQVGAWSRKGFEALYGFTRTKTIAIHHG